MADYDSANRDADDPWDARDEALTFSVAAPNPGTAFWGRDEALTFSVAAPNPGTAFWGRDEALTFSVTARNQCEEEV